MNAEVVFVIISFLLPLILIVSVVLYLTLKEISTYDEFVNQFSNINNFVFGKKLVMASQSQVNEVDDSKYITSNMLKSHPTIDIICKCQRSDVKISIFRFDSLGKYVYDVFYSNTGIQFLKNYNIPKDCQFRICIQFNIDVVSINQIVKFVPVDIDYNDVSLFENRFFLTNDYFEECTFTFANIQDQVFGLECPPQTTRIRLIPNLLLFAPERLQITSSSNNITFQSYNNGIPPKLTNAGGWVDSFVIEKDSLFTLSFKDVSKYTQDLFTIK